MGQQHTRDGTGASESLAGLYTAQAKHSVFWCTRMCILNQLDFLGVGHKLASDGLKEHVCILRVTSFVARYTGYSAYGFYSTC